MKLNRGRALAPFAAGLILTGCLESNSSAERVTSAPEALATEGQPTVYSRPLKTLETLPAGVAGDERLVFVGMPLEGRVVALSRVSGRQIGELPLPETGFVLPFMLHIVGPGRLGVLDAGGLPSPSPFVPANPTIYEYAYSFDGRDGFSAQLTRTVSFASATIGFAEDFVVLDDGRYLLSDAVLGALWLAESDGRIVPAIEPRDDSPEQAIPELAMCPAMPTIEVGGLPFLFSGSTLPGVSPLALRDGTLYFYSPCAEGLFAVPLASLLDARTPHERAADIELVSAKPSDVPVEQLLGLTFNPYDASDPFLYAADSLQLRIVRIDPATGQREVLDDDEQLFNFPSSLSFVPSIPGFSTLLVVSNQQHRTPLTNDAITEDATLAPYIVTKTSWKKQVLD